MKTTDEQIVVVNLYDHPVNKVWKAITDFDEMRLWYFSKIDQFEPVIGSKSNFLVEVEDRRYTHMWEVTEVVANEKIRYNWKYEEHEGDSFVNFVLNKLGEKTELILSCDVVADFSSEIPEFQRENCIAGWNYFLNGRLRDHLNGKKLDPI